MRACEGAGSRAHVHPPHIYTRTRYCTYDARTEAAASGTAWVQTSTATPRVAMRAAASLAARWRAPIMSAAWAGWGQAAGGARCEVVVLAA